MSTALNRLLEENDPDLSTSLDDIVDRLKGAVRTSSVLSAWVTSLPNDIVGFDAHDKGDLLSLLKELGSLQGKFVRLQRKIEWEGL